MNLMTPSKVSFFTLLVLGGTIYRWTNYPSSEKYLPSKSTDEHAGEEDLKFYEEWRTEMEQRHETVSRYCSLFLDSPNWDASLGSLLWQRDAHLAYCRHGKVGTSTWISLFLKISNLTVTNEVNLHDVASELFPPPPFEELDLNRTILFTVVRHPIVRLVSAYRNKIPNGYLKKSLKRVMKIPRNSTRNYEKWKKIGNLIGIDVDESPTFEEFIRFVLESVWKCTSLLFLKAPSCADRIDVHWRPFYLRCSPCAFNYDIIAKMETFNLDLKYIRYLVQEVLLNESEKSITDDNNIQVESFNSTITLFDTVSRNNSINNILKRIKDVRLNPSSGLSTEILTKMCLRLLTKDQKKNLKHAYRFDFLLYNYDPNEYG